MNSASDVVQLLVGVAAIFAAFWAALKWIITPRFIAAVKGALKPELARLQDVEEHDRVLADVKVQLDETCDRLTSLEDRMAATDRAVEHIPALRASMDSLAEEVRASAKGSQDVIRDLVGKVGELKGAMDARRREFGT